MSEIECENCFKVAPKTGICQIHCKECAKEIRYFRSCDTYVLTNAKNYIINCQRCDGIMTRTGTSQKYCKPCGKIMRLKLQSDRRRGTYESHSYKVTRRNHRDDFVSLEKFEWAKKINNCRICGISFNDEYWNMLLGFEGRKVWERDYKQFTHDLCNKMKSKLHINSFEKLVSHIHSNLNRQTDNELEEPVSKQVQTD